MSALINVPVRILKHQSGAFKLLFDGKPKTITLAWGRGLGKSFFVRLIIWLLVARWYGKKRKTIDGEMTGIRIYMLMPTLKQFKQVHGALLEAENDGKWSFLGGKLNKTDYTLTFPDGSFFTPVPAALATSERGRGFRGDVVIFDEGDDIDSSIRVSITQPWFTEPWSLALEFVAGTPKRGRHGMLFETYTLGQSKDPEHANYYSFKTKSCECPEIVSPRLLEKAKREYPPAAFAREFEVDFDSAEGLVYPFDESFHVGEPPPLTTFRKFVLGVDHGWSDPGCFLLCGLVGHGESTVLWALEEVYLTETPNPTWDKIAQEQYQGLDCYPDPSRPDRIYDLQRAGLKCHEVDNSIEAGVARVASMLFIRSEDTQDGDERKFTRLRVAPRCVNLIREFKSYRRKRDRNNANQFLEDIEDDNNHALDPLRYICMGEFGPLPSFGNYRHESPGS